MGRSSAAKLPEAPPLGPTADEVINNGINTASGLGDAGPATFRVVRGLGVIAGRSYEGVSTVAEADAAEAAAGSLVDFALLPIIAVILFGVILAYWIVYFERYALSKIPLSIGDHLKHLTDGQISALGPVVAWLGQQANETMQGVMQGIINVVHWTLFQGTGPVQSLTGAIVQEYTLPIKHELDHLWSWVNDINTWVNHIAHEVQTAPHTAVLPGKISLSDQVAQTQRDIARIQGEINGIHTNQAGMQAQIEAIRDQFAVLTGHVHGVRAVGVGWQDVEQQISALQVEIGDIQAGHAVRLDQHTGQIQTLLPLGVLLDAGAQGLENLQKLEKDICQCPRLPNFTNEIGTALALLHHVKGD